MKEFQRGTQAQHLPSQSTAIAGDQPSQVFTGKSESVQYLQRERGEWHLRKQKITFFYALVMMPIFFAGSVVAIIIEACPVQLKILAGVFLVSAGWTFIRYVTGLAPPLVQLLGELVRLLPSHGKGRPPA